MSEALHITERFARVNATTLSYQMTIDDPNVYDKPWTVSIPFARDDTYQMYEYACHEGNQAPALMLGGARQLEKEAAAGGAKIP